MNLVVAVGLVAVGSVYGYVRWRESQLKKIVLPGLQSTSGASPPINILLVGNNTRTGLDPAEAAQFGSATQVAGARSDVTMILHLDSAKNTASLLSIPRDLFVSLPPNSIAGGYGKIDAALNGTNGPAGAANGPNNLIAAISGSLGIPINHYISINFDGFQRTIDAIGGITMNFPDRLRDPEAVLNIDRTGCQHLNGHTALAVVRARHLQYFANGQWNNDPLSDLARIRRDHTFLRIFVTAAKAQMSNPLKANALIGALLSQVTVDSGLTVNTMLTLFRHFGHLDPNAVPETTLPITVSPNYHFAGGAYGDVDLPVQPADQQLIDTLSAPPASPAASSINVAVVNISGVARQAATIGQQLGALGFRISSATTGQVPATTTETFIRYHPGSVPQATAVLRVLAGAVVMRPDPTVADGDITIDTGSVVVVAVTQTGTTPGAPTTATAGTNAGAPTTTVPTAGGQTPSSSTDQPQVYDPIAC